MFGCHNCQGIPLGILIVLALMSIIQFKGTYPNLDGEVQHIMSKSLVHHYIPSSSEIFIMEHAQELGYDSAKNPTGCNIWNNINDANEVIYNQLQSYSTDLDNYNIAVQEFKPIPDLMSGIKEGDYSVCTSTRLHPEGLLGLFPSKQLSYTKSGYIEPLTPPMRSHKICLDPSKLKRLSLHYLVHDFEAMCSNLRPTSKRVLFDLGASLSFHGSEIPIIQLLSEYEKFGFHFDHIYAFEIKFTEPKIVYEDLLPAKYFAAYHWINVGEGSLSWTFLFEIILVLINVILLSHSLCDFLSKE